MTMRQETVDCDGSLFLSQAKEYLTSIEIWWLLKTFMWKDRMEVMWSYLHYGITSN